MKVADLIEDLETGDRTMEHLAKGGETDEGLTFQRLRDAVNSLGSGLATTLGQGLSSGLIGQGVGNLGISQAQNAFWNAQQSMNQQAFGMQKMLGGSPWNR